MPEGDPTKVRRALTADEVEAIFKHSRPEMVPVWRLYATTGMRKMELVSLLWSDIDFDDKSITIRASVAKGKRSRRVLLDDAMLAMLVALRHDAESRPEGWDREHVFVNHEGRPHRNNLLRKFYGTCKRAGIADGKRNGSVDLHSLRVTFTTLSLEGGASPKAVQTILGHATLGNLPPAAVARSRLVMVGLQQRLLSSIAAFARTLEKHRDRLERLADAPAVEPDASLLDPVALEDEPEDEAEAEAQITKEEDEGGRGDRRRHRRQGAGRRDAGDRPPACEPAGCPHREAGRMDSRQHGAGGHWNDRRLVLFTEYEDTRRWLERRLLEALDDLDPDDRIASFTGATPTDRREELKRRFNSDPATDPLRILICTDAAREGINLQMRCHDLIHIDLPWNPARLEQRNGRIDRKLQPSPEVWCRYFVYRAARGGRRPPGARREDGDDPRQLGSAGQVIVGSSRGSPRTRRDLRDARLADEIDALEKRRRASPSALRGDGRRDGAPLAARQAQGARRSARSAGSTRAKRVGVDPASCRRSLPPRWPGPAPRSTQRAHGEIGGTPLFRLDPADPALRAWRLAGGARRSAHPPPRPLGEAEGLARGGAAAGRLLQPARDPRTGVDAEDVVQLHLEHRLVRRLLSRFLSQGFASRPVARLRRSSGRARSRASS